LIEKDGSLLVPDDVDGKVFRVSAALPQRVASR
jgi:hypothetical protein